MLDDVSLGEIEVVQRHIFEAIVASNTPTTLSEKEQDNLLAQACAEACGILGRWVKSKAWEAIRPHGSGPIAEVNPDVQAIRSFLRPLGAAMSRMSERRPSVAGIQDISDPEAYVDDLIRQAEKTSRRHPRYVRDQLYADATDRIKRLQASVCAIAADFAKDINKSRSRLRAVARTVLKQVGTFLVSAALISAGVTTTAAAHDMSAAVHEAVSVVLVHQAAHTAQPTLRVGQAQAGAQLGPRLG